MIMRYAGMLTVAIIALAVSSTARADYPALLACAGQADPAARLACYDAETAKLKTELAEAQSRKLSLFGFNLPFGGDGSAADDASKEREPVLGPREVNQITGKLSSWGKDSTGHMVVTLDNGQSWKVSDYSRVPVAGGTSTNVLVVKNLFGGYYLNVNDQTNNIPVTRVK